MMTQSIVPLVLAGLTVLAPTGPIYPDSEKLPTRANRECRALRESGTRDAIYLGYRKAETILYRCQPSGRAVLKQRGVREGIKKKKGRQSVF